MVLTLLVYAIKKLLVSYIMVLNQYLGTKLVIKIYFFHFLQNKKKRAVFLNTALFLTIKTYKLIIAHQ